MFTLLMTPLSLYIAVRLPRLATIIPAVVMIVLAVYWGVRIAAL